MRAVLVVAAKDWPCFLNMHIFSESIDVSEFRPGLLPHTSTHHGSTVAGPLVAGRHEENDPGRKMPSSSGNRQDVDVVGASLQEGATIGLLLLASADKNASAAAFGVALARPARRPGTARRGSALGWRGCEVFRARAVLETRRCARR